MAELREQEQDSGALGQRAQAVSLGGATALVTGGGRGIGRAIAVALGRAGAQVVVNYVADEAAALQAVAAIRDAGGQAWAARADVGDGDQVDALFAGVRERFGGRLDILVNNAGGPGTRLSVAEMTWAAWRQCLAVNLDSVFLCTRAGLPLLPDGYGRIINVTSISARTGAGPGSSHYAAAKGAVSNFTRACAKELAPRGITVNGVAPGVIDTDLHRRGTPPAELEAVTACVPLGRMGNPEDIAGAAVFLASDGSDYITGQTIVVDGGLLLVKPWKTPEASAAG